MSDKKGIAILGSTGSIGTQALEVIEELNDHLQVEVLTAGSNADLLIDQARKFIPDSVVITDENQYKFVSEELTAHDIKVFAGHESLEQVVEMENIDVILTGLVGYSGLKPTLAAIEAGKDIALANKETLVVAGELITKKAKEKGVNIYPVDSEHSALFQCIVGESTTNMEKIYLTASGGPFRGKKREDLDNVTKEQALKHPNWDMGNKITIDSATMMNKGLEVIEAKWLFGLSPENIDIVVHPQSIIHSIVQFRDGSMKAQMSLPDMKHPIQYALSYPYRMHSSSKRLDFDEITELTFEKPDFDTFFNLKLAYKALRKKGNMPCIMNAANEIAVTAFLNDKIGFLEIPEIIQECMDKVEFVENPNYEDYVNTDENVREKALGLTKVDY